MIIFSHVSQCVVLCTLAVAESMPYDHQMPFPFPLGPTFSFAHGFAFQKLQFYA